MNTTSTKKTRTSQDTSHQILVQALKNPRKTEEDKQVTFSSVYSTSHTSQQRIFEVISSLEFFRNLFEGQGSQRETFLDFCASMSHEECPRGHVVFRTGDAANNKFYVILSGEVGIITPKKWEPTDPRGRSAPKVNNSILNTLKARNPSLQTAIQEHLATDGLSSINTLDIDDVDSSDQKRVTTSISSMQNLSLKQLNETPKTENLSSGIVKSRKAFMKVLTVQRFQNRLGGAKNKKAETEGDLIALEMLDRQQAEEDFKILANRYGNLDSVLAKGAGFGDLSSSQPDKKRTETALCKFDSEFIVIDAENYEAFIMKARNHRKEFIIHTLSSYGTITSTSLKNLIFNSFSSEYYSEGKTIVNLGEKKKDPKLFILEDGELKVEKKLEIKIKDPYTKQEIPHNETHWIKICALESGAIFGEEVLMDEYEKEGYQYRISVMSKAACVLSITKRTLETIHPHLAEQLRVFFVRKHQQRLKIFDQLSADIAHKNSEKNQLSGFLVKHPHVAPLISKGSLHAMNLTTQRTLQKFSHTHKSNRSNSLTEQAILYNLHQSQSEQPQINLKLSPEVVMMNTEPQTHASPMASSRTHESIFELTRPDVVENNTKNSLPSSLVSIDEEKGATALKNRRLSENKSLSKSSAKHSLLDESKRCLNFTNVMQSGKVLASIEELDNLHPPMNTTRSFKQSSPKAELTPIDSSRQKLATTQKPLHTIFDILNPGTPKNTVQMSSARSNKENLLNEKSAPISNKAKTIRKKSTPNLGSIPFSARDDPETILQQRYLENQPDLTTGPEILNKKFVFNDNVFKIHKTKKPRAKPQTIDDQGSNSSDDRTDIKSWIKDKSKALADKVSHHEKVQNEVNHRILHDKAIFITTAYNEGKRPETTAAFSRAEARHKENLPFAAQTLYKGSAAKVFATRQLAHNSETESQASSTVCHSSGLDLDINHQSIHGSKFIPASTKNRFFMGGNTIHSDGTRPQALPRRKSAVLTIPICSMHSDETTEDHESGKALPSIERSGNEHKIDSVKNFRKKSVDTATLSSAFDENKSHRSLTDSKDKQHMLHYQADKPVKDLSIQNPYYANLAQKSAAHKKLFHVKLPINTPMMNSLRESSSQDLMPTATSFKINFRDVTTSRSQRSEM